MAYTFEVETDFAPPIRIGEDYVLDFALGYELERSEIITMSVMLVAGDSYLAEPLDKPAPLESAIFDLQFGIRVHSAHNHAVSAPDFTIETSRKYIPDHARSQGGCGTSQRDHSNNQARESSFCNDGDVLSQFAGQGATKIPSNFCGYRRVWVRGRGCISRGNQWD